MVGRGRGLGALPPLGVKVDIVDHEAQVHDSSRPVPMSSVT